MFNEEKFIEKNIGELCQNFDLIRGKTVNIRRISPGIDSLKIVARRLLYIMFLTDKGKQFVKVAAITGECTSKLHHHSPASVKDTLVNLAQWWNNNIPLIVIHGNAGGPSGDPAGADRYILAKLSDYAYDCFFSEWKDSAVDMIMGADGKTLEPLYLPSKYPNILINGSLGIGLSYLIAQLKFHELLGTHYDNQQDSYHMI